MSPLSQMPGVSDGDVRPSNSHGLDLQAAKFSLGNARELALYARMAYDEPPTIQDSITDTQVLIRDLGDCVVVAFRGTSDLRDFVTDADCWRSFTSRGQVHHGFWTAWYSIRTQLFAALRVFGTKPVLLCGHSLGGALAMVAAPELRQAMLVNVHSVYTFGCPRVGDAEFQRVYNRLSVPGSPFENLGAATFTIINDVDIVPRVPGYLAGYRAPGTVEFIPEIGGIVENPSLWFRLGSDALSLFQSWWGRKIKPALLLELLDDHHIDEYIKALDSLATGSVALPGEAA